MWNGVVTNVGTTLLERWSVGGKTLNIERASVGSGTVAADAMRAQTTITDEVGDAAIISKTTVSDGTAFRIQVQPADETAYTCKQIGIWGKLSTDNESILIALFQNDNGVSIPTAATEPEFVFTLYAIVAMSNQGQITVNIDGSAYVSQETLDLALASYVKTVNGIAPGTDGNVTLPIDDAPTAGSNNPVKSGALETIISGMKSDVSAFYSDGTTIQTVSDLATAIKAKPYGSRIVYRLSPNVVKALAQSDTTLYGTAIVYKASANNAYFLAFNRDTAGYGNISLESDAVTISHHIVENVFERNTVYSQGIYSVVPGIITNGQYHIDLTLMVPKSLQYISSITVTRLVGGLRHSGGGYVGSGRADSPWASADGVDLVGKSGLTIIATKVSNCSIRITLANTKQFTEGTTTTLIPNNSIVNFYGQLDLMLQ